MREDVRKRQLVRLIEEGYENDHKLLLRKNPQWATRLQTMYDHGRNGITTDTNGKLIWQQQTEYGENSSRVTMNSRVKEKPIQIMTSRLNEQSAVDLHNVDLDITDLDADDKRVPGPGDTISSRFIKNGRSSPEETKLSRSFFKIVPKKGVVFQSDEDLAVKEREAEEKNANEKARQ